MSFQVDEPYAVGDVPDCVSHKVGDVPHCERPDGMSFDVGPSGQRSATDEKLKNGDAALRA
eukprot:1255650-Pyramimonas_sp.AAC.1